MELLKESTSVFNLLLDAAVGIWELTDTDFPLGDGTPAGVRPLCLATATSTEMALKKQWPVVLSAQVFATSATLILYQKSSLSRKRPSAEVIRQILIPISDIRQVN